MYTQHYYHKQTAHTITSSPNNETLILLATTSCSIIIFIAICGLAQCCVRKYHQDTSDHSTDPEAWHPLLVEERSGAYQTFALTSHRASAPDPASRRMMREERVRERIAETYRIWVQGNAGMESESDSSDSESGYEGDESSESESDSESESESSDDSDGVVEVRMPLDMRRLALPKRVEALRGGRI
ncbi:hypothetical protein EJ07DRAFT_160272 [Lizonia empirigonia]|nr:hypothetical protein EJ07DRAFT_160272 [Lizonia empirigonia]